MTLHVYYGALCVSMAAVGPMALCGRYGALRLSDSLWPLWRPVAAMGRCVSMAAMALYGRYGALYLYGRYGALWPLWGAVSLWPLWRSMAALGRCVSLWPLWRSMAAMGRCVSLWPLWRSVAAMGRCVSLTLYSLWSAMYLYGRYDRYDPPCPLWGAVSVWPRCGGVRTCTAVKTRAADPASSSAVVAAESCPVWLCRWLAAACSSCGAQRDGARRDPQGHIGTHRAHRDP